MDIFTVFKLLGSLALLMFGMKALSEGLQKMAGPQMRLWLQNRYLWMNHQLRAGYTSNGTLTLGPNPTTRYIEITGNTAEMESVKIYDLQGQCMLTMEFNGVLPLIDLYSLPRGIYIALIATHQETVVKKVVKL